MEKENPSSLMAVWNPYVWNSCAGWGGGVVVKIYDAKCRTYLASGSLDFDFLVETGRIVRIGPTSFQLFAEGSLPQPS